jgi:hypothetical protein
LRRLGHAGKAVGTLTPGTIGSTMPEGLFGANSTCTVAVPLGGSVWVVDQIGWVPFGAAIVTLILEPAR